MYLLLFLTHLREFGRLHGLFEGEKEKRRITVGRYFLQFERIRLKRKKNKTDNVLSAFSIKRKQNHLLLLFDVSRLSLMDLFSWQIIRIIMSW